MKSLPIGLWCGCLSLGSLAAAEPALTLDLGGTPLELRLIRAGEFTQGSPANEAGRSDDETAHPVRLTHDYYIGRTSVTRGQWQRFAAETGYRSEAEAGNSGGYGWDGSQLSQRKEFTWRQPGFPQTDRHPVCLVTYPDAEAFCRWAERKLQRPVRLPTEAEWEYACRAGTTTPWFAATTAGEADRLAWHQGNAGKGTHEVDSTVANPWDLFIGGNVAEWCRDWYAPYPSGLQIDPRQNDPNLSDKPRRVLRGGSWLRNVKNTRSAARYRADPRSRNADIGFRIVCEFQPQPATILPTPVESAPSPEAPTPPPVAPHESNVSHSSSSSPFALLRGLLCLLIPVGAVVAIVKLVRRSSQSPTASSIPGYLPRQVAAPARSSVRKTDDGFWIQGDWPPGTLMNLRYVIGGVAMAQSLMYRPGPDGHFVFTGSPPDSVSIAEAAAATAMADTLMPPPFPPNPPATTPLHRPTPPPRFPSAY